MKRIKVVRDITWSNDDVNVYYGNTWSEMPCGAGGTICQPVPVEEDQIFKIHR